MRDDEAVTGWALAARTGDERAVEQFVRATQLDVRRYVTHLSGDPQATDDLVQDTYVRALRSLPRFEGRSSARTWLLTIARRVVADRIRSLAARPRLAATDDWQTAAERVQPRGVPGSTRASRWPNCWRRWRRSGGRRSCSRSCWGCRTRRRPG